MKTSTKTGWLNKYASGTSSVKVTPAPQSLHDMFLMPLNKVMAVAAYNKKEVDPKILMKQLYRESKFDQNAGSSKGAKGLAQITNNTLKYYKSITKDNDVDPYNANDAIKMHKWIMNDLYNSEFIHKKDQSPDVRLLKTLAAYNMGRTNLSNYLNKQKEKGKDIYNSTDWIKGLPVETRNYINDVFYNKNEVFNTEFNKAVSDTTYKPIIKEYTKSPVVINDDRGQWDHPGEVTRINSNSITMEQVPYPVLGVGADGQQIMMYPEEQHTFNQGPVTEYPMMQAKYGGWLNSYSRGGVTWLNEYQNGTSFTIPNNQPTTQDSLNLYNSQIALNNFYENEVAKGRYKKRDYTFPPSRELVDKDIKTLPNENIEHYRNAIKFRNQTRNKGGYDDYYKKYYGLSPAQLKSLEYKGLGKSKSGNQNQIYYRDLITPMQNLAAPFAMIDSRILPDSIIEYEAIGDVPGGGVSIYNYDPLRIKPYSMLTPAERNKKYPNLNKPKVTPTQTINSTQTVTPEIQKQQELVKAGFLKPADVDGIWGKDSQKAWDLYQSKANTAPEWKPNPNDLRADGTQKGTGFLGVLPRPDGGVSSEISIGVEFDGKETEIPTMVPTLSKEEVDYLLTNPTDKKDLFNTPMGKSIMNKAINHAKLRMSNGLNPFYQQGEKQPTAQPVKKVQDQQQSVKPKLTYERPVYDGRGHLIAVDNVDYTNHTTMGQHGTPPSTRTLIDENGNPKKKNGGWLNAYQKGGMVSAEEEYLNSLVSPQVNARQEYLNSFNIAELPKDTPNERLVANKNIANQLMNMTAKDEKEQTPSIVYINQAPIEVSKEVPKEVSIQTPVNMNSAQFSVGDIAKIAKKVGFIDDDAAIIAAIAMKESGGNPLVDTKQSGLDPNMEKEYSIGLTQINWKAHKDWLKNIGITNPDQLRDPETNLKAALALYKNQGNFNPWSGYKLIQQSDVDKAKKALGTFKHGGWLHSYENNQWLNSYK